MLASRLPEIDAYTRLQMMATHTMCAYICICKTKERSIAGGDYTHMLERTHKCVYAQRPPLPPPPHTLTHTHTMTLTHLFLPHLRRSLWRRFTCRSPELQEALYTAPDSPVPRARCPGLLMARVGVVLQWVHPFPMCLCVNFNAFCKNA